MLLAFALSALTGCASPTPERPTPLAPRRLPAARQPLHATAALLRVHHPAHVGRPLWVDGERRGPLPQDLQLLYGLHVFEIEVAAGDRLRFERELTPRPGIRTLDLSKP